MGRGSSEFDWLRFHQAPLGDRAKKLLLEECESPSEALSLPAAAVGEITGCSARKAKQFSRFSGDVDRLRTDLERCGAGVLTFADRDYPPLLREIIDPPPVLFFRGDRSLLSRRAVAIVGSRRATAEARRITEEFAGALASRGIVITSGLALGIDAAAHRGALGVGGSTVAVLGNGPDSLQPKSNRKLGEEIVDRGAVISDYPPGAPVYAGNFPLRNRIIAGMCGTVLITQAADRSGASITGNLAVDNGRNLAVLSPPVWDRRFAGNVRFAKDGAHMVYDAGDLLGLLGLCGDEKEAAMISLDRLSGADLAVAEVLADTPSDVDEISRHTGLIAADVLSALMRLELSGMAHEVAAKKYSLSGGLAR